MKVGKFSMKVGKKGQAHITEIIMAIAIAATTLFILIISPKLVKDTVNIINHASADNVASNLASLISLTAASPHTIKINYKVKPELSYNVEIHDRIIKVELLTEEEKAAQESSKTIPIDVEASLDKANGFVIEKTVNVGINRYSIRGD